MSDKPSLFSELRRRNVFRVALTYAVIAWLLIEIASVLLPLVNAPESIITAFVVLLALGFAVALFISWAFEMTPEGLKRTQDLSPDEVIPYWSRRKFATFILASQALRFVFLLTTSFSPRRRGIFHRSSRFRSRNRYLWVRLRKNRAVPNLSSNFFVISMRSGRKLQQLRTSSRQSATIRLTRSYFLQTQRVRRRRTRFEMFGKTCSRPRASSSPGNQPKCNCPSPATWGG